MRIFIAVLKTISRISHRHMMTVTILNVAGLLGLVVVDWILGYEWYGHLFMIYVALVFGCSAILDAHNRKMMEQESLEEPEDESSITKTKEPD